MSTSGEGTEIKKLLYLGFVLCLILDAVKAISSMNLKLSRNMCNLSMTIPKTISLLFLSVCIWHMALSD